jgi:hypothetical protein
VSRSGAQRTAGRCYAHDERRHGAQPRSCGRGATCSGSDRRDRTDGEHESPVLAMRASA